MSFNFIEHAIDDKKEDFAQDLRSMIDCNLMEADDNELIGVRVVKMEPIEPGKFEVIREDGAKLIVTVTEA